MRQLCSSARFFQIANLYRGELAQAPPMSDNIGDTVASSRRHSLRYRAADFPLNSVLTDPNRPTPTDSTRRRPYGTPTTDVVGVRARPPFVTALASLPRRRKKTEPLFRSGSVDTKPKSYLNILIIPPKKKYTTLISFVITLGERRSMNTSVLSLPVRLSYVTLYVS